MSVTIKAAVHSARFDNTGACKLTLEIDGSQAIQAAALAVQVQQLFDVTFELEGETEQEKTADNQPTPCAE